MIPLIKSTKTTYMDNSFQAHMQSARWTFKALEPSRNTGIIIEFSFEVLYLSREGLLSSQKHLGTGKAAEWVGQKGAWASVWVKEWTFSRAVSSQTFPEGPECHQ